MGSNEPVIAQRFVGVIEPQVETELVSSMRVISVSVTESVIVVVIVVVEETSYCSVVAAPSYSDVGTSYFVVEKGSFVAVGKPSYCFVALASCLLVVASCSVEAMPSYSVAVPSCLDEVPSYLVEETSFE